MSKNKLTSSAQGHKSGFVSIVGRPNAGKSTLLNALVGHKLAIVSERPQTTRAAIQGVLTRPDAQIVFLDTPGIHESTKLLNRRMMEAVRTALEERDAVLYLGDATLKFTPEDARALDVLKGVKTPVLLLLNKIDRVQDKRELLPRIEEYRAAREFAQIIPVSAITGEGVDRTMEALLNYLPAGPAYFPPDHITDQPERFMAAEIIREKILRETRQEVPHAVAVVIDRWQETPRLTRIAATIYVERDGQKAIVIGSKGSVLKKVGTHARREMEALFSHRIFLELFVKVRRDWRDNRGFLETIDWRTMRGAELETDLSEK